MIREKLRPIFGVSRAREDFESELRAYTWNIGDGDYIARLMRQTAYYRYDTDPRRLSEDSIRHISTLYLWHLLHKLKVRPPLGE